MEKLPECGIDIFESGKLRTVFLEAIRSLSRLNAMIDVLPNIDILTEAIPLQESCLSCAIENIVTSQDEVFRAYSAGEGQAEANLRDVMGYRKAIHEAEDGDLSIALMERICSSIKRKEMKIRSSAKDVVYLKNNLGDIISTPPSGDCVPELLESLLDYYEKDDSDPLIKVLVSHAYFEMIHPFKDGNGRTGRILNEVLMQKYGLLSRPVLHLSRFLTENRRDYYRFLRKVERDNDWEKYLFFMLNGVKYCADHSISVIKKTQESITNAYSVCGRNGFSKDIVDQLYSHIYIRSKHLVEAGLVSRNTASSYLSRLEELGILRGEQAGKGKIYVNVDLYRVLSE